MKKQEYTNAASTNLVNAAEKVWDLELIERLGLPTELFGELSMPGTVVGELTEEMQAAVGFNTTIILPATHDTGSAFLAVPARDENAVYLSSGTWSLMGVENGEPITSEASRLQNFTNEGGAWYRFRYLKNIMGLWMIQSIRRELNGVSYVAGRESKHATGRTWSFPDLTQVGKLTHYMVLRLCFGIVFGLQIGLNLLDVFVDIHEDNEHKADSRNDSAEVTIFKLDRGNRRRGLESGISAFKVAAHIAKLMSYKQGPRHIYRPRPLLKRIRND